MKNTEKTMEKIVALCKNRGFVFPGSEIYGGLANSWDYGPLGVEMKNNVKRAWWKKFVQENPYNVGLDSAILMNPQVWVASGHVSTFNDPLIDCKACKMRHRADKLIEGWCAENGRDDVNVEAMTNEELVAFIRDNGVLCGEELNWSEDFLFNLEYIRYAHRFCAVDTPVYYYVKNEKSITHTQIDLVGVVKTKAKLFTYYKGLYESLGLYEKFKPQIYKYLVATAEHP